MRSLGKSRLLLLPGGALLLLLPLFSIAVEDLSSAAPPSDRPSSEDIAGGSSLRPPLGDGAVEFPFKDKGTQQQWRNGELSSNYIVTCSTLRLGQFRCNESLHIDPDTQQLHDCNEHNLAPVPCEAAKGLICKETNSSVFTKQFPCKFTNGYRYDTALLLSVFLGWLGADRLYLGHVGMGAVKMVTLGFFFIGHLVDIILVATQTVRPIDSSNYIVGFYGPSVQTVRADNLTLIVRRPDWW